MAYETILYEKVEEKIFRLTLNRPEKRNAMSERMLVEIDEGMSEFAADDEASVLVIRGAGKSFCAGYDLAGGPPRKGPYTITQDRWEMRRLVERWQRLWNLPKPTIAEVHGHCLAGATELVGHCDLAFASEDALFGHPAGRALGVLPTLSMWPYLIGMRRTKELLFTGDSMTAAQALEWGLLNRVVPREHLEEEVLEYARRVAQVPVDMLTLQKAATNRFFELMGVYAAEQSSSEFDVIAHQTTTAKEEFRRMRERGVADAVRERDRRFTQS